MTKHAVMSPSGFKALMLCPAKPAMERPLPDQSSRYADEGTNCHTLAALCLERNLEHASEALGFAEISNLDVTDDMAECVDVYLRTVRDYQGADGELHVEVAVPIGHITGEEGAHGTADAVILRGDEIIVIDLKTGRGVKVSAGDMSDIDNPAPNPQLALYALGALEKFGLLTEFTTVRMVIVQPRVGEPSEYVMGVDELQQWAEQVAKPSAAAARAVMQARNPEDHCHPHEDACRWCRAKPTCPALAQSVEEATEIPVSAAGLGAKMDAVPLVEMWCSAIRGEVERELLDGKQVPGYKLVQGRKGARAWTDKAEAEAMLKSFRFKKDEMYDYSLISPTSAEKLLKEEPRRWQKVQALIKQPDGKPSVAPVSDKRPAIEVQPIEAEFTVIESAEDLI
jgi:uncharacterized protein DUF2800